MLIKNINVTKVNGKNARAFHFLSVLQMKAFDRMNFFDFLFVRRLDLSLERQQKFTSFFFFLLSIRR